MMETPILSRWLIVRKNNREGDVSNQTFPNKRRSDEASDESQTNANFVQEESRVWRKPSLSRRCRMRIELSRADPDCHRSGGDDLVARGRAPRATGAGAADADARPDA
jgi:hypothetical protein